MAHGLPPDEPYVLSRRILCRACQRVITGYTDVHTGRCVCDMVVLSREDLEWLVKRVCAIQDVQAALGELHARYPRRGW